mgnify:CR=1 FL=1
MFDRSGVKPYLNDQRLHDHDSNHQNTLGSNQLCLLNRLLSRLLLRLHLRLRLPQRQERAECRHHPESFHANFPELPNPEHRPNIEA